MMKNYTAPGLVRARANWAEQTLFSSLARALAQVGGTNGACEAMRLECQKTNIYGGKSVAVIVANRRPGKA